MSNPDKIKQWLSEGEWESWERAQGWRSTLDPVMNEAGQYLINSLTCLAATRQRSEQRRVLMDLNQWCGDYTTGEMFCPECHDHPHKPDCLWAQAIEKGE